MGDVQKNNDRLKYMLLGIRFPQIYDQKIASDGHPTQFLKVLHYTLFAASSSVKNFLFNNGVDPDTIYLNDYKFMKKVFHILVIQYSIQNQFKQVNIFGYKPSITIDQFFKYGFAEQKMLLCCDTITLVKKAARDIKVQRSLSRKRSSTNRSQQYTSYQITNHKQDGIDLTKSYHYERDTVNKLAKVKPLDSQYQTLDQQQRSTKRGASLDNQQSYESQKSLRYSHVKSRYMQPKSNNHQSLTVDVCNNQSNGPDSYTPLRVRSNEQIDSQDNSHEQPRNQSLQKEQGLPKESDNNRYHRKQKKKQEVNQNDQILTLLKQTLDGLNNKFDTFQKSIDNKIDRISNNYEELNSKLESMHGSKVNTGNFQSLNNINQHLTESFNPLSGGCQQEQPVSYQTQGFQQVKENFSNGQQNHHQFQTQSYDIQSKTTQSASNQESEQLIKSIRKNLDEAKEIVEEKNHAVVQQENTNE